MFQTNNKCIKYLLGGVMTLSLFLHVGFAQDAQYNICGYNQEQLDVIETAKALFTTYAEEKVIQRHFSQKEYIDLARATTDEVTQMLDLVLSICRDGNTELYDWTQPMYMSELNQKLAGYKTVIDGLAIFAQEHTLDSSDVVSQGILMLQKHFLGEGLDAFMKNVFIDKKSEFRIDVRFDTPEVAVTADIQVASVGVGDMWGTNQEANVGVISDLTYDDRNEKLSFKGGVSIDVRIIDNHMYIKIVDSNLGINESSLDDTQRQEWEKFKESLQLAEGKWIDVLGGMKVSGLTMLGTEFLMGGYQSYIDLFLHTPLLTMYTKEGEDMYAGINPLICNMGRVTKNIGDCLHDMWLENWTATQGKGFLHITQNGSSYTLAFTDKHMTEKLPEEMAYIRDVPLLTRNANAITYALVPFADAGNIVFKDGNIQGKLSFPHSVYKSSIDSWVDSFINVDLNGTRKKTVLSLQGTLVGDALLGSMSLKKVGGWKDLSFSSTIRLDDTSDTPFSFGMSMILDVQQKEISPIKIVAPHEDEIIDISFFN